MAEHSFQEVMRQAQRMCEYRRKRGLKCNDCDAVHICGLEIRHVGLDTLCADADAVMAWAAEHPAPKYPTFGEWLEKQGIVKLVNSHRYEEDGRKVYMLLESVENQIPADIAQMLGIEPKEGV